MFYFGELVFFVDKFQLLIARYKYAYYYRAILLSIYIEIFFTPKYMENLKFLYIIFV